MNFEFHSEKATQVACLFAGNAGGQINIMKLVKLIYLLDRLALSRRGHPVVGGRYVSMRNGPLTSEILALINGDLSGNDTAWDKHFSDRANHLIEVQSAAGTTALSKSEVQMVAEINTRFGTYDKWQLVKWCHDNCTEWHEIQSGCHDITPKRILHHLGKKEDEINYIVESEEESEYLSELLG